MYVILQHDGYYTSTTVQYLAKLHLFYVEYSCSIEAYTWLAMLHFICTYCTDDAINLM